MSLPPSAAESIASYRTLVVEGHEGVRRTHLFAELALLGFPLRCRPGGLHHLDPTLPYRDLLAAPGPLVIDGGIVGELVYGPLRHGRSRVTWIQVLDLAEAVAERDGAMLHLTGAGPAADGSEATAAALAYARVFRTLAQHVPVVTVDITGPATDLPAESPPEPGHRIRAPSFRQSQLRHTTRKLTIG
ncbi:hypothetical protein [Streptomyces geranii]|uniref:hypothetical protein n=1 Tax=Streptomyces geranii TaxID=2058923 RepID=UPI000D03C36B|nr:hypothetical protein [Streptomyces geranii]